MRIIVESTITGHQELLTVPAFYKKFGKAEGREILAGYDSSIIAFKTGGCTCGEGNDLHLGHCDECPLRRYQEAMPRGRGKTSLNRAHKAGAIGNGKAL